jgi:lambda repressor-like predicted transcriptional regulator
VTFLSIKQDVQIALIKRGWNLTRLNEELNKRNNTQYSVQNLSNKLARNTLKYREAEVIAEILGLKIEWVSKN